MTLRQLISDAHQLIEILMQRFDVTQVYLLARSWGSLLGIFLSQRYPEIVAAAICSGQLVAPMSNDSLTYQSSLSLAEQQHQQEALQKLQEIGPPPYDFQHLIAQRRLLTRLSKESDSDKTFLENWDLANNFKILLSTPQYTFMDILRMGLDPFYSIRHLWNEDFYRIDLRKDVPRLDVPVCFLVGRKDLFTPPVLVEDYYRSLEAPYGKRIVWFENSGHHPEYDEPEKFCQMIVSFVLSISHQE
jgi:pimeloyl-ACP methyl ester carboxylesterase